MVRIPPSNRKSKERKTEPGKTAHGTKSDNSDELIVESDGCWYRVVCCDACRYIPKLDQAAIAKAELSLAAPFVLSPYHSAITTLLHIMGIRQNSCCRPWWQQGGANLSILKAATQQGNKETLQWVQIQMPTRSFSFSRSAFIHCQGDPVRPLLSSPLYPVV